MKKSRLYTFIDQDKKFALYFLEGQKLIYDLILTHELKKESFAYFRSTVLSIQLMLGLLKHDEYFCYYIDSESPYFRLKIEMNTLGLMRGMIYADHLNVSPNEISGQVRLIKTHPGTKTPYNSTISLDNVDINEILNCVLKKSYQVNSRISVSETSDQSFMIHQLPLTRNEEMSDLDTSFFEYSKSIEDIMAKGLSDEDAVKNAFKNIGFKFLASQPVEFKCGCSRNQMIENVKKYTKSHNDDSLFEPGENTIDVICEYCKTTYRISKKDLQKPSPGYH